MPVFDVSLTIQDIDAETKDAAAEAFFSGLTAQIASGAIHVEVAHEPKDAETIEVPGDKALAALRFNMPTDPVLRSIRSRAKAHDAKLTRRVASPTGDDYNDLFAMLMDDATTPAVDPAKDALKALTEAIRDQIRLHGNSNVADPVMRALKAAEIVLKAEA